MIYEVVVNQKTSLDTFDYSTSEPLTAGQLVKVPFNNKTVLGVIYAVKSKSSYKVKPIKKVLTKKPILSHNQFKLAKMLTDEYLSSLSDCIFSFLPKIPDKYLAKFDYQVATLQTSKKTKIIVQFDTFAKALTKIQQTQNNSGQRLIMLPEIADCQRAKNMLKGAFLYNSTLNDQEKLEIYEKLLSGADATIISTRIGCLLPFTRLKKIFMFDPANFAYQEDQDPKYNGEKLALMITKLYGSDLNYITTSFDLFNYVGYKKKMISLSQNLEKHNINIVETKEPLSNSIKEIINKNKNILYVWANDFESLNCSKCSIAIKCLKCKSLAIEPSGKCKSCSFENLVKCSQCNSIDLNLSDKFFEILKNELPANAKLIKERDLSQHYDESYGIVIYANNDYLLESAGYGAWLKQLTKIRKLLNFEPKEIFIITQKAESKFWTYLTNDNYENFFEDELRDRKLANLPPFSKLLKIKILKESANDRKIIQSITTKYDHLETDSGYLIFIPHNIFSSSEIHSDLRKLRGAKFYIDPIDLN